MSRLLNGDGRHGVVHMGEPFSQAVGGDSDHEQSQVINRCDGAKTLGNLGHWPDEHRFGADTDSAPRISGTTFETV